MKEKLTDPQFILELSEEDIFGIIGYLVEEDSLGAFPKLEKSKLIELGKKWFESNKRQFQEKICNNEKLKRFNKVLNESDELDLCLAIADILAGTLGSIPPMVISAQIVKLGLKKLCYGNVVE